jgi:hypothetical protein
VSSTDHGAPHYEVGSTPLLTSSLSDPNILLNTLSLSPPPPKDYNSLKQKLHLEKAKILIAFAEWMLCLGITAHVVRNHSAVIFMVKQVIIFYFFLTT